MYKDVIWSLLSIAILINAVFGDFIKFGLFEKWQYDKKIKILDESFDSLFVDDDDY